MRTSKPIRRVSGGYQALISQGGRRLYLGTYDSEGQALYAHQVAATLLGIASSEEAPTPPDEEATAILEKVEARLQAHAKRPGRHHRSPSLVRRDNLTGWKGVSLVGKPWRAHVTKDHRRYALGSYTTQFEAAVAYNLAATVLHGPGAVLNRIPASDEPSAMQTERIRRQVQDHLGILRDPGPRMPE